MRSAALFKLGENPTQTILLSRLALSLACVVLLHSVATAQSSPLAGLGNYKKPR